MDLCGVTVSPREGREDWNGVIDAEYNEIKGFDRRSAGNSGGGVTSKHFLPDHGRDDDGSVLCEKKRLILAKPMTQRGYSVIWNAIRIAK